jgi:hypothetical protein
VTAVKRWHHPRPGAAHRYDDAAGTGGDVGAADMAQVGADQSGARPGHTSAGVQGRDHGPPLDRRFARSGGLAHGSS